MKINVIISGLFCYFCLGCTEDIDIVDLPFSAKLGPTGNVVFQWNFTRKLIKFQVTAPTTGWLGIGFSPSGTMKGADIIFSWLKDGKPNVLDMHGVKNGLPVLDTKNNIRYSSVKQNGTHTCLYITRLLDTCDDEHDFRITEDTTRVIFAYGDNVPEGKIPTTSSYHGSSEQNRGVKSLLLLERKLPSLMEKGNNNEYKTHDISAKSHTLPPRDTYYHCFYHQLPVLKKKHHMVEFGPILTPGNEKYVHHITIYHCNESLVTAAMLNITEECYVNDEGGHWKYCAPVVVSWAVGMTSFTLPKHVGFPIGVPDSPKILKVELHYDNVKKKKGIVDASGMRVVYTNKLRKYDAGILLTGHDVWPTLYVPPESRNFVVHGHCSSQCLGKIMELGNMSQINVFGVFLHSHTAGHAMMLRHYRNGTEYKPIAVDMTYDFDYQETKLLTKEKKVNIGDNLVMECTYDTIGRNFPTSGGLGTKDEMCFGFVMYYPKMNDAFCQSSPKAMEMYKFLGAKDLRESYYIGTMKNWTDEDRKNFNHVQLSSPSWELCRTLSGQITGLKQPNPVPVVEARFEEAPRTCKSKKKRKSLQSSLKQNSTERKFSTKNNKAHTSAGSNAFVVIAVGIISGAIVVAVLGLIYDRFS